MKNLVTINNKNLEVKEFEGQRVVTFKEIDKLHERVEGTAKRNFTDNKEHFIKGIDYFIVKPSDVEKYEIRSLEIPNRGLTLMTESGYLMLVKSLSDDLAWTVQRELVNKYFRAKSGQADNFKTTEEFLIYQLQEQLKVKKQLQEQDTKINETKQELTRMKDCMLSDIDNKNWREETNTLLFKTACRMARVDDELDRDDYLSKLHNLALDKLKERTRCNLNARLKHMKERMLANGATKTQINKLRFLDVIEQDNKLLYAYIAIVKEIGMKN